MKPVQRLSCVLCACVVLCGCESSSNPPRDAPVPVAQATPNIPDAGESNTVTREPTEKQFAGITVTIPAGWEVRPPASDVIQAEYRLPGRAGPGRLTMSSTGGGIEANLSRWRSQFTRGANDPEPSQTTVSVDGAEAVIVELYGTFRDGFSGAEEPNWSMLGAAIPTGPATFFIKLTGPRETVAAHRDEFTQLVKSARLTR